MQALQKSRAMKGTVVRLRAVWPFVATDVLWLTSPAFVPR